MEHSRSTVWLFGRSLLPSTASSVACFIISVGVVAGGTLLNSISYGTLLPGLFDGTVSNFYASAIVQPLETLFSSATWSSAAIVGLWGLFGVTVYSIIEAIIRWYANLREARNDVQFEGERIVARHPLERSFFTQSLWRLGVSIISFLFIVAVQPVMQYTFHSMRQLVTAATPGAAARKLMLSFVAWVLIAHVCIVLLRLYVLRTRLFGDRGLY